MALSHAAGAVVPTTEAHTIAHGIAVRNPVPSAVEWLRHTIDEIALVDDDQILGAMRLAYDTCGQLLEPAGAAGLAAVLAQASALKGSSIATILCDGNLTPEQITTWLPSAAASGGRAKSL